jgi:sigma-B regulation protein RsbU (phosphoserine phosphatase)
MTELINNIMDFARTRLGQGIVLDRRKTDLSPVLQHVAQEIKTIYPERKIIVSLELAEFIDCDPDRLGQLVSNLLANAVNHGFSHTPVYLHSSVNDEHLEIVVTNNGEQISPDLQEILFTPFTREANNPARNGLGLGLYISAEIAKAHNAILTCNSTMKETRFILRMPLINSLGN